MAYVQLLNPYKILKNTSKCLIKLYIILKNTKQPSVRVFDVLIRTKGRSFGQKRSDIGPDINTYENIKIFSYLF